MNILITGGAGYLGSVLTEDLLIAGHNVTVVDNFMYGQTGLAPLCASPRLRLARGDAADIFAWRHLLAGIDAVIPLAAIVGAPACKQNEMAARRVNLEAVQELVEILPTNTWILFPNTNSGYGRKADWYGECTEEDALNPISVYGTQKVAAEREVLRFRNSAVFRFATLFGCSPRMRLDLMVNDFCYRAVRDRALVLFDMNYRRNFLHVRDAARVFLFALEHFDTMRGQVYNAGLSSANITKRQLCEAIERRVPGFVWMGSSYSSDPDKRDYVVSNAKLEALGWRPERTLSAGIEELIRAFSALPYAKHTNAP